MVRSGVLVTFLAATTLLTGCSMSTPEPDVQGQEPPAETGAPVSRSCPDGFAEALAAHVAATTGDDVEVVEVVEDEDYRFAPAALDETVADGCVVRVERTIPDGVMMQVLGVAKQETLDDVLGLLNDAGWVQPFPDIEPHAFESEPRNAAGNSDMASVGVFSTGGTDPIFGFTGWSDYFGESSAVLQSA
jgi:hypothetical protein